MARDEREREPPRGDHAGDADGARRAHVDEVEAALCERLQRRRHARDADAQARRLRQLEVADRGEPPVDVGVGAEDLDLEARHAARADLLDHACDAVRGADPVDEDGDAGALFAEVRAPESSGLVGEEGAGGGIGDHRHTGAEERLGSLAELGGARDGDRLAGGGRGRARLPETRAVLGERPRGAGRGAQHLLVRPAGSTVELGVAEVLVLEERDQRARVQALELDRLEPRPEQFTRVLRAHALALAAAAGLALAQQSQRHGHDGARVEASVARAAGPAAERPCGQRDRGVRPLGGAPVGAARRGAPRRARAPGTPADRRPPASASRCGRCPRRRGRRNRPRRCRRAWR